MYKEWFLHMNKLVQSVISFYIKDQILQVKMNVPIYSLIST